MEPLLSQQEKEGSIALHSRSSTPSNFSQMHSRRESKALFASPGASGARKPRWLGCLFILVLVVLSFVGLGKMVKKVNARRHVYDITLSTRTTPYMVPKDPQKVFDWSTDTFLPPGVSSLAYLHGSIAEFRGRQRDAPPAKQHAIAIHPTSADLAGLPDNVKAEEIVFGFTSPYLRVRDMCRTWRHFLKEGAQCVIALPKEQETFIKDLRYYLDKEKLSHCQVFSVDLGKYDRYEQRVMNMPRLMQNQSYTDATGAPVKPKWFVVADDDTQVLDIRLLQREMSTRVHTDDHFVCALTESKIQATRHGRICYGGGGILLSASFAKKMADHTDECFWWHHWRFGGDEMLTHCASTSTANATGSVPPDKVMEYVDGLHQIDIPGDGTGFLQSGLPFITIHHYTGWLELFPSWSSTNRIEGLQRLQKASDLLGGDNIFKRYMFDDGATMLTLGYSVTLYSQPLRRYELQLIENTHRHWEHDLRWPSRPGIPEGKRKGRYKTTYYLTDVLSEENTLIYQNQRKDTIRIKIQS